MPVPPNEVLEEGIASEFHLCDLESEEACKDCPGRTECFTQYFASSQRNVEEQSLT